MIPYDLDPSLHEAEPEKASLDDGFAPPPPARDPAEPIAAEDAAVPALSTKSLF